MHDEIRIRWATMSRIDATLPRLAAPRFPARLVASMSGARSLARRWVGALAATLCACPLAAAAPVPAPELPPTLITYRIEVTLDPATRALHGVEWIVWKNPGDATIEKVPV